MDIDMIKQPWVLTKASYSFTITEDRVFRQILLKMQDAMSFDNKINLDSDFETEIRVKDFLPHEKSTNHLAVAAAIKKLRENTITFYKQETEEFVFTGIQTRSSYGVHLQSRL